MTTAERDRLPLCHSQTSTNTIDQRPKAMKYKKRRERVLRQNRLRTIQNKLVGVDTNPAQSTCTNCRKWKQFRRFNVSQSECTVRDGVPCNVPHRCIITVEPSSPGEPVMAETPPLTLTEVASASSSSRCFLGRPFSLSFCSQSPRST